MTDRKTVEWFGSVVQLPILKPQTLPSGKIFWKVRVTGEGALRVVILLLPWLVAKRPQAMALLRFGAYSSDRERGEEVKGLLERLNGRERNG